MVKACWGSVILMCTLALHPYNEIAQAREESVLRAVNASTKGEVLQSHFEERAPSYTDLARMAAGFAEQIHNYISSVRHWNDSNEKVQLMYRNWRIYRKQSLRKINPATEKDKIREALSDEFQATFSDFQRAVIIAACLSRSDSKFQRHIKIERKLLFKEWMAMSPEEVFDMLGLDATHSNFLTDPLLKLFVMFLEKYNKTYEVVRDKLMEAYMGDRGALIQLLKDGGEIGAKVFKLMPEGWENITYYPPRDLLRKQYLDQLPFKNLLRSDDLKHWCKSVQKTGDNPYRILLDKFLNEMDELNFVKELDAASNQALSNFLDMFLAELENALYERWNQVEKLTAPKVAKVKLQLDLSAATDFFQRPLCRIYLSYIKYCKSSVHQSILRNLKKSYKGVPQIIQAAREADPRIASIVTIAYEEYWKTHTLKVAFNDLNLQVDVLKSPWLTYWLELAVFKSSADDVVARLVLKFVRNTYSEQAAASLLKSAIETAPSDIVKDLLSLILTKYIREKLSIDLLEALQLDKAKGNLFNEFFMLYWILASNGLQESIRLHPFTIFYERNYLLDLSESATTNTGDAVKQFANEMIKYLNSNK
ncbi:hypothetical protein CCR75_000182 [Bremia lactucae]|uniref:RxLR effector protein n=1 Tax=Bremia lactucae TaxID=4779 RepID=A0A976FPB1_BRELC|nr:hypothetical protein CCR75_000184 [Bremia lactucae]TDH70123.1 hypothetical protein CCR75_000182 [Bremia lactucae]